MSSNAELAGRRNRSVTPGALSVHPIYPVKAQGSDGWDAGGKKVPECPGRSAVMNLGHPHPQVRDAVKAQIHEFQHLCFAVGMNPTYIELAEKLQQIAPGPSEKKVFLANSGAEAVEKAVKIARVATGRQGIVSFTHDFLCRPQLALSIHGM